MQKNLLLKCEWHLLIAIYISTTYLRDYFQVLDARKMKYFPGKDGHRGLSAPLHPHRAPIKLKSKRFCYKNVFWGTLLHYWGKGMIIGWKHQTPQSQTVPKIVFIYISSLLLASRLQGHSLFLEIKLLLSSQRHVLPSHDMPSCCATAGLC